MTIDVMRPILVAEDDPNDALLLIRSIRKADINNPIVTVPDGDAAIEYLGGTGAFSDRDAHPLPVVLLLDLKMPRRSGFDVLAWLRAQPELGRLPVVVLTSSRESVDIERAYALGVNSYLVKPGTADELVEIMRKVGPYWLGLNESPEISR